MSEHDDDEDDDDITKRIRRTDAARWSLDDTTGGAPFEQARTTKEARQIYPFEDEKNPPRKHLVRAFIELDTGQIVGVSMQSDRMWSQHIRARLDLVRSYLPPAEGGSRNVRDDVIEELCDILEALLARLGM